MKEPKYRFSEFNTPYTTTLLGDCFEERTEKSEGNEELLSVTQSNGVIKQSESDKKNVSSENKSNYKKVYAGDIAYNSMRMWQGAEGLSEYDGIVSPAYTIIIPKDIHAKYFEYKFKSQKMLFLFQRFSQGMTSDTWNLKFPQFSNLKVTIPSVPEQKKIATLMALIDKRILTQTEKVNLYEEQRKSLIIKLLTKEVRFTREDGSKYPEMENCQISDYINFTGGSQPDKKYFIYEEKEGYIRLIQTQDYRTDKYKTYIPLDKARRFCDEQDVMIGRYGPPVFQIKRGLAGSYNVALIKAESKDLSKLDREFMYFILSRNDLFLALDAVSRRSAGQAGVDMDLLNNYPILLPSIEEQRRIVQFLSTFDQKLNNEKAILDKLQELKKGCLQQLFA